MTDSPPANVLLLRRWVRRLAPWLLVLALGIGCLYGRCGPVSSGPAPALTVTLNDGTPFDLADQRGQVVVLNFWAAWCPPCRAEAPALSRVHHAIEGHGARIVGLAVDAVSLNRAERLGMDYPQALVREDDLERFGVGMLPTTIVVDAEGQIVHSFVGEIDEAELRDVVDEALAAAH